MSDHKSQNEEPTLEALRDALGYTDVPDQDTVDMVMTGYDIVNLQVITAALTYDSDLDEALVSVRDDAAGMRSITAEGGGYVLDLDIRTEAPELIGRIRPIAQGEIALDQSGNHQSIELEEHGSFEFGLRAGQPFRLRFIPTDGESVATDWIE